MSADAVLFDLDDTFYPYPPCNEAGKEAARRTARERGYDLDRDAFETLYRAGRREVKRELGGTAASHERVLYFKRGLELHAGTHRGVDARAMGEAYWDAYVAEMSLVPGVEETLATLRDAGVAVAVVTNLTARIQLRKLEVLGLDSQVDLLLTSEETGREKPGSVMFTLPLARLDVRASETVAVGDDVEADVAGANAVGLETVLFAASGAGTEAPGGNAGGVDDREEHRRPDHRIDTFADLTEVVL